MDLSRVDWKWLEFFGDFYTFKEMFYKTGLPKGLVFETEDGKLYLVPERGALVGRVEGGMRVTRYARLDLEQKKGKTK